MRFLVTGGAGFIGAALCNRLATLGHEVRALDDLSAGDPSHLQPAVLFTRGDVNDIPRLWTLLQGVDVVYHLAARVSVPESVLFPRDYNAVNVGGTVSVLEAMRAVGVGRIVLGSSGAVYGEQATQPLHEAMRPAPRSPYAVSKLASEQYLQVMGALWQIETVSLRIFNAYGPGQQLPASHPPVIPAFIKHGLKGSSIVVHGDGEQTRDYIFIDDVIQALVTAADAQEINGAVINVGSGVETSVNALVAQIGAALRKEITPLHTNTQSGGVQRMQASLDKAAQYLGFRPQISLAEGLNRTLLLDPRFAKAAR